MCAFLIFPLLWMSVFGFEILLRIRRVCQQIYILRFLFTGTLKLTFLFAALRIMKTNLDFVCTRNALSFQSMLYVECISQNGSLYVLVDIFSFFFIWFESFFFMKMRFFRLPHSECSLKENLVYRWSMPFQYIWNFVFAPAPYNHKDMMKNMKF